MEGPGRAGHGEPAATAGPAPARTPPARDRPFQVMALVGGLVLVAFVVFVVVQAQSSPAPTTPSTFPRTTPSSLAPGTVAPAFSLARLGGGAPVTLPAAGTPTILNFFASWCSHCRAELRSIATVAAGNGTRVTVVGVDTSDPATATVEHLLAAAGATYAVGVDPTAHVAEQYHVTGLPVTYFIATTGKVDGVAFGAQTTSSLDRWVRRLAGDAS